MDSKPSLKKKIPSGRLSLGYGTKFRLGGEFCLSFYVLRCLYHLTLKKNVHLYLLFQKGSSKCV